MTVNIILTCSALTRCSLLICWQFFSVLTIPFCVLQILPDICFHDFEHLQVFKLCSLKRVTINSYGSMQSSCAFSSFANESHFFQLQRWVLSFLQVCLSNFSWVVSHQAPVPRQTSAFHCQMHFFIDDQMNWFQTKA